MSRVQTDNHFLNEKVQLRIDNLPATDPVRVLDMFSGNGVLWDRVSARTTGRDLQVLRIDQKRDRAGIYLRGDNRKYSLDLSAFDIIDLDAYGVPFPQLSRVLRLARPGTVVFATYIQTSFGRLPNALLAGLGFSPKMVATCPSLFMSRGQEKLLHYLGHHGVAQVKYYTTANWRKTYLCFTR